MAAAWDMESGGGRGGAARIRAHEALPHTPPGGEPPETPGPLSLLLDDTERRESVKGSQAAQKARALDRFSPFEKPSGHEGKGACERALSCLPLVGPVE
jgi:hypothetical protein